MPGVHGGVGGSTAGSVVSLLQSGIPGIQYAYVDPDVQFQKFLIVLIQAPSGTDPLDPPDYNARLTEQGKFLELTIPVCQELSNAELLVHKNASKGDKLYRECKLPAFPVLVCSTVFVWIFFELFLEMGG